MASKDFQQLESAIAAAVRASSVLPQAERQKFIGAHLKAQARGANLPIATAASSKPSSAELTELSSMLGMALNIISKKSSAPGCPSIAALAEELLKSSPDAAASSATSLTQCFTVDALLASVESGAIAPLSGRWLVELQRSGGRIERRQDLPAEAFLSATTLRRLAGALGETRYGLLFVVLSYKWLTPKHCDPDGFHLSAVADAANTYLLPNYLAEGGGTISRSPLTAAFEESGLEEPPDFALFWECALTPSSTALTPSLDSLNAGLLMR